MTGRWLNPVRTRADVLARAAWGALAAIHVPILLKSSAHLLAQPGWEHAGAWAVVVASLAFFAAKVAGTRVLDIRCRKTAAIVFLVACGLLHGPVRERALTDHAPETVAVLAAAGVAVVAAGRVLGRLQGTGKVSLEALLAPMWAPIDDDRVLVTRAMTVVGQLVPRGPPVP
jgi:hypothetical protein